MALALLEIPPGCLGASPVSPWESRCASGKSVALLPRGMGQMLPVSLPGILLSLQLCIHCIPFSSTVKHTLRVNMHVLGSRCCFSPPSFCKIAKLFPKPHLLARSWCSGSHPGRGSHADTGTKHFRNLQNVGREGSDGSHLAPLQHACLEGSGCHPGLGLSQPANGSWQEEEERVRAWLVVFKCTRKRTPSLLQAGYCTPAQNSYT